MLPVKIIQLEPCRKGLSWDDPVNIESKNKLDCWLKSLSQISFFSDDKCMKLCNFSKITKSELYHFFDASEDAYGCISYVRNVNEFSGCHTSILSAKCRSTPIQRNAIPRLELNAATISIKNDQTLRKELKFKHVTSYYCSDSVTVLRYIYNESRTFKAFMSNRIAFIWNNSNLSQWRYMPGLLNTANKATRITFWQMIF